MRKRTREGKPVEKIVEEIVRPNERLTSFERLEIYNRGYWFRLLETLAEDFPGLRAIVGQRQFDKLLVAYLDDCPSESFTLRDLGSRLEGWLRSHLEFVPKTESIAVDMVRLEWADIDAFDTAELPKLSEDDLRNLGDDPRFLLQPHLHLLDLDYPVDELLLSIRGTEEPDSDIASNAVMERARRPRPRRSSLPKRENVYLAVHRQDHVVYFKRLEREAFALVRALQQGKTLSEAIEASVNWSNLSVEHVTGQLHDWFANWSSLGWFSRQVEK